MPAIDRVKEDLDYVANAVRRQEPDGIPAIYFMWSLLVAIGFALPDFAPRWAGLYWFTTGLVVAASLLLAGLTRGRRKSNAPA